jgi:hypothetical protein
MIVKIGGKIVGEVLAAAPLAPGPTPPPALPGGIGDVTFGDVAFRWFLDHLGKLFHDVGMTLLHLSPDMMIILGMIGCLGVIMNIKNTGKFTVGAVISAIMLEVVRMEVGA